MIELNPKNAKAYYRKGYVCTLTFCEYEHFSSGREHYIKQCVFSWITLSSCCFQDVNGQMYVKLQSLSLCIHVLCTYFRPFVSLCRSVDSPLFVIVFYIPLLSLSHSYFTGFFVFKWYSVSR